MDLGANFSDTKKKTCFRESHFGGIKLDANVWFNKALLRDNGGSWPINKPLFLVVVELALNQAAKPWFHQYLDP